MLLQETRTAVLACLLLVVAVADSRAQTIIIDPPFRRPTPLPRVERPRPIRPPMVRDTPLVLKTHTIDVTIVEGVATTHLEQAFENRYPHTVEGTYVFPLDDDIAFSKFSMFVNGQEVEGELLGVEEARREYESIVARMRDPALLEYLGTRMFRARIFPIDPNGTARIKLSYTQILRADDGLVRYRFPLAAQRSVQEPIENLNVVVHVESKTPIKSVFSPTHSIAARQDSPNAASASFEGKNVVPDKDFELMYTLSEKEFGLSVLTYRENGEDGFFLVRIAPPTTRDSRDVLPKDISFVIDTSGSMAGEKMAQAVEALKFCLANLNDEDRFNIIAFSHEAVSFRPALTSASPDTVKAAREFVEQLRAGGGTNINDALRTATKSPGHEETDRPHLVVFLTDGQPTIGVTDVDEILKSVRVGADGRVRLFVFGVGYDVNTDLLDLLAEQNRGTRDYIQPGENIEVRVSSFYRKVAEPVLADLALAFNELSVYDLFPPKLGDLFAGTELVVAGRYKGEGVKAVELTGVRRGKQQRFVDEARFPSESTAHEFLPRIWATRKIGYLLDQIRLHGEDKELKDTIVELAVRYGIVTPYTAYLVTEPGRVSMRQDAMNGSAAFARAASGWKAADVNEADAARIAYGPAAGERRKTLFAAPGGGLVRASRAARAMQDVDHLSALAQTPALSESGGERAALVRTVGGRTFYLVDDRWLDTDYDSRMETTKIKAFSSEYFKLIRKHSELAKCFALGERVVVVLDGTAYETVPPEA